MIRKTILLIFLLLSFDLFAQTQNSPPINQEIIKEIKEIKENVLKIKNDQLNYQIEKELLKETYSSHFQTISLVITLALAILGIIGFFGISDIKKIRAKYNDELEDLKNIKKEIVEKINSLLLSQDVVNKKIETVKEESKDQSIKIQIVESQERAINSLFNNYYPLALEYVDAGLILNPENVFLLHVKSECLLKMGNISEALEILVAIINIKPNDITAVCKILELYLLAERFSDFLELFNKSEKEIKKTYNNIGIYFNSLKLFIKNDSVKLISYVKSIYENNFQVNKKCTWSFDFILSQITKKNNYQISVFISFIKYLQGLEDFSSIKKNIKRYYDSIELLNNNTTIKVIEKGQIQLLTSEFSDLNLAILSKEQLKLLKNTIYAKYGANFKDIELQMHFSKFNWYNQKNEISIVNNLLNKVDKINIKLIDTFLENEKKLNPDFPETELIGFWHIMSIIASGYADKFIFWKNHNFRYDFNQMDWSKRINYFKGTWKLSNNQLILFSKERETIVGGIFVDPYASCGSDFGIESGQEEKEKIDPPITYRFPLNYQINSEIANYREEDNPLNLPSIFIGNNKFWKFTSDPDDSDYFF